ncbi:hypothetical protein AC625_19720 [Peribacillus loiseleuriae]|uniref:HTH gntR-type domain-containing protein n=1 Tax=Peribacillus loiseleuriae TaxID=1679170 RepID=A0A0K9GXX5_9BACI|nr:GntR family transcriptional regulator [Peribacillus loiseleuriae]KMY51493.1 hypothetical protein AC625_19720 [Peribacillus loiseleuriae]
MYTNNNVPLYLQLKEKIIKLIDEKELKVNDAIPSEPMLTEKYNLSRTTVRKALDDLVNEGYLYRVHGKGTFVDGRKIEQGLVNLSSCTEDMNRMGLSSQYVLLKQEIKSATPTLRSNLNLLQEGNVFHIERVMYGNESPVNVTKSYIPYQYVKGIEKYDFEKESLYKVLKETYNIKIIDAVRSFEAVLSDLDNSKKLGINEGVPLIMFEGQVKAQLPDESIVQLEYFKTYYRTDQVKFYINQFR